jgi:hypothetical protein
MPSRCKAARLLFDGMRAKVVKEECHFDYSFSGKFLPAAAWTVDCITVTPPQQRYKNEAAALSGFPSAT